MANLKVLVTNETETVKKDAKIQIKSYTRNLRFSTLGPAPKIGEEGPQAPLGGLEPSKIHTVDPPLHSRVILGVHD